MAEYSANAIQIVNPGESIIFTDSPIPCNRGFIRHREGSGNFLLSGWLPRNICRCKNNKSAKYLVDFGANISVPATGTVEPITVAFSIDGSTIPATSMTITPAAVDEYFNVSRASNVDVWNGCCETFTIRNTSSQPIQVQNANVIFERSDLIVSY